MVQCVISNSGVNAVVSVTWANIPLNTVGTSIELPNHSDKTIHFYGTFGGATVTLYGSNDPNKTAWVVLKDTQGSSIASSSASMFYIPDNPRFLKVETSGGDGTTAITAVICAKRA